MKTEKGIRRTETGWRAYGRVSGVFFSQCFPIETTLTKLKAYREGERVRLREDAPEDEEEEKDAPSTFQADVETYLAAVKAMPTYNERKQHVEEWAALFGDRPRSSITSAEVRAQLQRWKLDDYAASSVNHRRSALMHLFRVLDADLKRPRPNPVAAAPRLRPADPQPRGLPYATVTRVLQKAQPYGVTTSYARLVVLAWTGLPPATLQRITAKHWDRKGKRIYVPGRQKGKGTQPRYLPLTPEGTRAFALLSKLKAWGAFSTSSLNRLWKRAAKKVKVPGTTLYDLRHSFGTAVYAATGDIQATASLLGHSDTRQSRRYALAALDPRARAALQAFRTLTGAEKLQRKLQPKKSRLKR
jgi:integrase